MPAPRRSDEEARALLDDEIRRLTTRKSALGLRGTLAVAGWTLQQAMEWEGALLAWTEAAAMDPEDVEAAFSRGMCLIELSRFADAAAAFRDVIGLDARLAAAGGESLDWMEDDPAYRLGIALHAQGLLDDALAAYEESARRNEVAVDAIREIVRVRIVRNEPEEALLAVRRLELRAVRLSVRAEAMAYRSEAKALLAAARRR